MRLGSVCAGMGMGSIGVCVAWIVAGCATYDAPASLPSNGGGVGVGGAGTLTNTGGQSSHPVSSGGVQNGGVPSTGGHVGIGGSTSAPSGGAPQTGGNGNPATGGNDSSDVGGNSAMGGTVSVGGQMDTGGTNVATGGTLAAGGSKANTGGVSALTGGASAVGGASTDGGAQSTGGSSATSSGGTTAGGSNYTGPCDIYAAASPATPCVAAYALTRRLNSKYTGPLYQVRKGGNPLGSGGTTQDIGATTAGTADAASQDALCAGATCTVSIIYDQSGQGNDLKVSGKGCYTGTAAEPDYESSATKKSTTLGAHKVYGLYMIAHDGYRNNISTSTPTGNQAQGIYELVDGKRYGGSCCWDFGGASKDNCYNGGTGTMNAIFFGNKIVWGSGAGSGPWFMADLEAGVWAGGSGASTVVNGNNPSMGVDFAFGILKTNATNYAIRVANGASGSLTTAYDGNLPPLTWNLKGGIILGTGGDNSNWGYGTFYEGVMTSGRPSDATDAAVLANVQAAKYGQ